MLGCFHHQQIYYIEEIIEQPIFLNPHNKLNVGSNTVYFHSIPPKHITDKFTIIKDLCIFLQPGLISHLRFEEKLGHIHLNPKIIFNVMDLVLND